ncbi:MAG: S-adenosylmethionine:tRNA ribosyltransferase-isomerase, partial [Acidimicrobiales bacterium]
GERIAGGRRIVELRTSGSVEAALAANGELPLPPYITAPVPDFGRYQTVYATHPGSVAAPTAGLHLTEHTIAAMNDAGASIARVQLRVGLDTFRPLGEGPLDHHVMHTEIYAVPEQTWELIGQAERVVAVGTTVVRALESVVATGELSGRTNLFIRSPYEFGVVDALLTNFHMPRSTLLVMIDAFIGPRWRELYQIAIDEGYRMLSFGDGMFLTRRTLDPRSSASR